MVFFVDIIKITIRFIKTTFKNSVITKRIKNDVLKCNFFLYFLIWQRLLILGGNADIKNSKSVSLDLHIFWSSLGKVPRCSKFHHCEINGFCFPHLWAAPKRLILNRVNFISDRWTWSYLIENTVHLLVLLPVINIWKTW